MYNKLTKITILYISLSLLFIAFCLAFMLKEEQKYPDHKLSSQKVNFIGEYTTQNSSEAQVIPEDGKLKLSGRNSVILTGHFQDDIPKNNLISMRIDNLHIRIFHKDELIYSFGDAGSFPQFAKSAGNIWDSFISPGFSTDDELRIELSNIYTNRTATTFERFLNNLHYGYDTELISKNLRISIINVFASLFILCLGLMALFFSLALLHINQPNLPIFCFSCLALSCGVWFFIDFNIQHYFVPYSVFNNSLDIVSLLVTAIFSLIYVAVKLKSKAKYLLFAYACLCMLFTTVATITQVLGIYDYYEYISEISWATLGVVFLISGSVIYERRLQHEAENYFTLPSIILAISMLADLIFSYYQIIPVLFWFKIGFFSFVIMQFWGIMSYLKQIISKDTTVQVLQELAYTDSLTGVKNRTAYLEKTTQLEDQIQTKTAQFAVIVFDINNLKKINDKLGHEFGDIMIVKTSEIICTTFKKSPVYRIGGDEFVVILENSDLKVFEELQAQLAHEIELYNLAPKNEITISLAYGIAFYKAQDDFSYNDIFKRADESMYRKKLEMKSIKKMQEG